MDVIPINGETWIVCGGRDFDDRAMFNSAMGDIIRIKGIPERIVHGGARGADTLASHWAIEKAVTVRAERADWDRHGKAAGPIRNQTMLDTYRPSLVVAFPGGRGTADMVRRARENGVDVAEIVPAEIHGHGLGA